MNMHELDELQLNRCGQMASLLIGLMEDRVLMETKLDVCSGAEREIVVSTIKRLDSTRVELNRLLQANLKAVRPLFHLLEEGRATLN